MGNKTSKNNTKNLEISEPSFKPLDPSQGESSPAPAQIAINNTPEPPSNPRPPPPPPSPLKTEDPPSKPSMPSPPSKSPNLLSPSSNPPPSSKPSPFSNPSPNSNVRNPSPSKSPNLLSPSSNPPPSSKPSPSPTPSPNSNVRNPSPSKSPNLLSPFSNPSPNSNARNPSPNSPNLLSPSSNPPSKPSPSQSKPSSQTSNSSKSPKSSSNATDSSQSKATSSSNTSTPKKGNKWEDMMQDKLGKEKEEEREIIRNRRKQNAGYMDKQIRNIIDILKQNGGSIKYGVLFQQTADKTDALSAILHTGKKRGVFEYEGVMLMQGNDDEVEIKLLRDQIEDSKVAQSTMFDPQVVQQAITPSGPEKCYICQKTVYPTERIAPNNKVMHKACFRCKECNSILQINGYCLNNGKFYCKSDYDRLVKLGNSYQF